MPIPVAATRLLYFPVPKAACTSIKRAILIHNAQAAGAPSAAQARVHEVAPTTRFHPLYPVRHLHKRWFCVIRDPVQRVLSAYANRVVFHGELADLPQGTLDTAGLPRAPDLETFIRRLPDYARLHAGIDHHTRALTHFLGDRPRRYHRIFTLPDLETLPAYLKGHGAPDLTLGHEQTGGPRIGPDDLPPALLADLRRHYAEDYRIWGPWLTPSP
ncbi:sulfotransferase family 2 domain-containing protein [Actibacterium sp. 188UL27-1]|uniref:sulfotransferase family 2 domain-containing protein n=1 Tax=Actibacterium sp. 188UL27-1 TaxID=2786961 RepID=UPI001956D5D0|nr:sulfotransferase family 2 domain-containing protein [Actibacterium sp. 188UL27-1]MBM7070207.1 sulfotransferase family 2 domain-containing protein [Actibacterium sp. 188UL27-1]